MFCNFCGEPLDQAMQFCPGCGRPVRLIQAKNEEITGNVETEEPQKKILIIVILAIAAVFAVIAVAVAVMFAISGNHGGGDFFESSSRNEDDETGAEKDGAREDDEEDEAASDEGEAKEDEAGETDGSINQTEGEAGETDGSVNQTEGEPASEETDIESRADAGEDSAEEKNPFASKPQSRDGEEESPFASKPQSSDREEESPFASGDREDFIRMNDEELLSYFGSREDGFILPGSATTRLTDADMAFLKGKRQMLSLARNEIFARHGYRFTENAAAIDYFNKKTWYQTLYKVDAYDYNDLSDIEKSNVDLIQRYEDEAALGNGDR